MLKKIIKKINLKNYSEALLVLFAFVMAVYFKWEVANAVFFILFIILMLHPISSRLPAFGAIMLLVITAGLLMFKKEDWAEASAIWAYYLMIFTVTMSFLELRDEKEGDIMAED